MPCIFPSHEDMYHPKTSMNKETKLPESSMMNNNFKDRTLSIKVLHTTECNIQNMVNYNTCCLVDKLQIYNKKVAVHPDKCAKCMETLKNVQV